MNLYICSKNYHDNNITYDLNGVNILFPEVNIPHYDWFDYINEWVPLADTIVTQSSEILKFIRVTPDMDCNIYVETHNADTKETTLVKFNSIDDASLVLLKCYELLMVKGYLFKD